MACSVSIIIPCFNLLAYTRQCVESILEHTSLSFEIILVDSSSSNATMRWFSSLQESLPPDRSRSLKYVRYTESTGIAASLNRGISISWGLFICYVNNDTVLTRGWLENMVQCAKKSMNIGIVGCCTNSRGMFPSTVNDEKYRLLHAVPSMRSTVFSGRSIEVPYILGFCMLIKRSVINKIGVFDEQFSPGFYEDFDYCLRACAAGYTLVKALDVFIFHYENKTTTSRAFTKRYGDPRMIMASNAKKLLAKWGRQGEEILRVFNMPLTGST